MADWGIAAQVQPPAGARGFDPIGAMQDIAQLQNYQALAEERRRKFQAQQRIQQLAGQYGDDTDALVGALEREFPFEAQELSKAIGDARKSGAQAEYESARAAHEQLEFGLSLMQGVTPENYANRRDMAMKIGGDVAGQLLPEQYDEQAIGSAVQTVQTVKDYLQGKQEGARLVFDGKMQEGVGRLFMGASTPELWADALKLAKSAGLGGLAAQLGEQPTPEGIEKAKRMSLGPEKIEDIRLAEQREARQTIESADTARHQRETERIARGQLAVSQGNLKARQEEAKQGPKANQRLVWAVDPASNETRLMTGDEARALGARQAPTADMRNRVVARSQIGPVLSAITELSERINTGQGAVAKATGEAAKAAAILNLNDDVSEYQAVLEGFTPMLARAVGHTGVLTQQDVDSVKRMLPAPGDSKSVRDRKVARVAQIMGAVQGSVPGIPGPSASSGGSAPATPASSGPKVGERRRFPGGKIGEWDGKGWKQVP